MLTLSLSLETHCWVDHGYTWSTSHTLTGNVPDGWIHECHNATGADSPLQEAYILSKKYLAVTNGLVSLHCALS